MVCDKRSWKIGRPQTYSDDHLIRRKSGWTVGGLEAYWQQIRMHPTRSPSFVKKKKAENGRDGPGGGNRNHPGIQSRATPKYRTVGNSENGRRGKEVTKGDKRARL